MKEQEITTSDLVRAALDTVAYNAVPALRGVTDPAWRARQREVLAEFETLGALLADPAASVFVRAVGAALQSQAGTWSTEDPANGGGAGYRLLTAYNGVSAEVQKACRLSPPDVGELAAMRRSEDRFWQALAGAVDRRQG